MTGAKHSQYHATKDERSWQGHDTWLYGSTDLPDCPFMGHRPNRSYVRNDVVQLESKLVTCNTLAQKDTV